MQIIKIYILYLSNLKYYSAWCHNAETMFSPTFKTLLKSFWSGTFFFTETKQSLLTWCHAATYWQCPVTTSDVENTAGSYCKTDESDFSPQTWGLLRGQPGWRWWWWWFITSTLCCCWGLSWFSQAGPRLPPQALTTSSTTSSSMRMATKKVCTWSIKMYLAWGHIF